MIGFKTQRRSFLNLTSNPKKKESSELTQLMGEGSKDLDKNKGRFKKRPKFGTSVKLVSPTLRDFYLFFLVGYLSWVS